MEALRIYYTNYLPLYLQYLLYICVIFLQHLQLIHSQLTRQTQHTPRRFRRLPRRIHGRIRRPLPP